MADNQLNEKSIEKKLMSFSNTQESVQAMSLWIMHNRSQHQKIVNTWIKVLRKSEPKHKLTLFYLCNDVVQHAKRKKALYYLENFKDNLREAVHIIRELDKIKPSVSRIFKIWEERRTYDAKFINELRKILESEGSGSSSANVTPSATASPLVSYKPSKKTDSKDRKSEHRKEREKKREEREKKKEEQLKEEKQKEKPLEVEKEEKKEPTIPSDFKTNLFIEEMTNLRQLDSEANLKAKQLAAMRIDATNMEAVKQLKDRSHGNEFCKQFEESCLKIEDYVEMLEKEIKQRRTVLSMCEDAEAFYDEQYSEAKIVATAYKNFGARVTNMKKRVDDMKKIIPSTPSPVPSPTADAPSPGGTPPLQDMDDNDTVDMDLEEESAPQKLQESDSKPQPRGAYTAMVKSIPQPISSVTNITMQNKDNTGSDEPIEISPEKDDTPPPSSFNSVTDTFQGSKILESRIASMLPNLAKGASNLGPHAPVLSGLQDESRSRDTTPDFVPPKLEREEEDNSDDRSSTPVMDEPEEKEPTPTESPPPVTKPPTTKVKTNPIDFLSQLLTKTSNSSSSSNFLQSLSLLTNTVKSQYQKQQESGVSEDRPKVNAPPVSTDTVDAVIVSSMDNHVSALEPVAVTSYIGVPPPEPITQTSSWSGWKPVITPPQPPLLKPLNPSPPVLPSVKSPEGLNQPPLPQHPPPLPPEPFPGQPPSPQTFSRPPPPVSQTFLPSTSVAQPYGPPRPPLQPFSAAATSPSVFPPIPVNSQAFPASHPSTSPVAAMPPVMVHAGFNPQFPFGPPPEPRPTVQTQPPPSLPPSQTINLMPQPPSQYLQHTPRPWLQQTNMRPDIGPPHSQGAFPPPPTDTRVPPPPSWQREIPHSSQPSGPIYGNVIHTLSSNRPDWEQQSNSEFGQRQISEEETSWNEAETEKEVDGGYAHPWDQPKNFQVDEEEEEEEDEDLEIIETNPQAPQPLPSPAPKSILRNRSSSLREVILVDDSIGNNLGSMNVAPSAPDKMPAGMLRKPPIDTGGGPRGDNVDVQSEFIAKLKQKSGGATHMPPAPPASRTLTSVSIDSGIHVGSSGPGHSISTIGVISSNGRTSSVKSDDMDLDSDEHDSNVDPGTVEQSQWDTVNEHIWQERDQSHVTRDYTADLPLEDSSLPPSPYRQPGPSQPQSYNPYSPRGYQPHRPPRYRDHYRGPPPPKSPMFPPAVRPRMPYYRY